MLKAVNFIRVAGRVVRPNPLSYTNHQTDVHASSIGRPDRAEALADATVVGARLFDTCAWVFVEGWVGACEEGCWYGEGPAFDGASLS